MNLRDLGIKSAKHKPGQREFIYTDENGKPLLRVVRFDLADGRKEFTQQRYEHGGWKSRVAGVRSVPYNLLAIASGKTKRARVYVVEGEKNAEDLISRGLLATCNVGGAGKWTDECSQALRGRDVVLIPDNDRPGRDHVRKVAASLRRHGAKSIKVVQLPGLPDKGDVSDWLEQNGTIEQIRELAKNTHRLTDRDIDNGLKRILPPDDPPRFPVVSASEIKAQKPPEWLVENLIPVGALAVLFGEPGTGKSFVALDLALSINAGTRWRAGLRKTRKGGVVYIAAEGSGGLGKRVNAWEQGHAASSDGAGFIPQAPALLDDSDDGDVESLLDTLQRQLVVPALVVIDTMARTMVGGEENSARDVGQFVRAADKIREAIPGCAVLIIHHTGKDGKSERGSSALRGAADVMMKLSKLGWRMLLTCEKSKDAEPFAPVGLQLESVGSGVGASCFVQFDVSPIELPDAKLDLSTERILEALRSADVQTGISAKELAAECELPTRTCNNKLRALRAQGQVQLVKDGRAVRYVLRKEAA